jgi:uncharacterized membrane protein YhaH (DUF805 family)
MNAITTTTTTTTTTARFWHGARVCLQVCLRLGCWLFVLLRSFHRAHPETSWFLVGVALPYWRAATTSERLRDYHWRPWIELVYFVYNAETAAAKNVTTVFYAHKVLAFLMYCCIMAVVFNLGWTVVVCLQKAVRWLCTQLRKANTRHADKASQTTVCTQDLALTSNDSGQGPAENRLVPTQVQSNQQALCHCNGNQAALCAPPGGDQTTTGLVVAPWKPKEHPDDTSALVPSY